MSLFNWRRSLIVFGLLQVCIGLPISAAEEAPAAEQIAGWVKQLGDEAFEKRTQAEASLRKAGDAARSELEKAVQSEDRETKSRSTRLLAVLKTEPLLKKMEAVVTNSKNMDGDIEMTMKMMGMAITMKMHFKGTGDGKRFNLDGTTGVGGQQIPTKAISDGTTMWSEATLPGQDKKMVQKFSVATMEKLGGGGSQNPIQGVKELRERFDFTDVKEGKLGQEDVQILEGKIREGVAEQQAKVAKEVAGAQAAQMAKAQIDSMKQARIYIRKADMLVLKSEVLDDQGEIVVSMQLSNMKLDVKLNEDDFKYTPPAGVEVMDMEEAFKAARNAGGEAPQ